VSGHERKDMSSQTKLVQYLQTALSEAIGSMTGKEFTIAFDESGADAPSLVDAFTWQQSFSPLEGPSFWIAAGRDLWETMGRVTLEAAGIEEVTDEDCRSTWREILNQTISGIGSAMTAEKAREIAPAQGVEITVEPPGLAWLNFSVSDASGGAWRFKAGWTNELAGLGELEPEAAFSPVARANAVSKTFDLLLEVALPIAVSFGRTSLQIREVLKLNTGSIVELDRFVTDPVEVIVNECVIARGEVVVVDGNYGVRINQLASREDRLRSGMAEAAHKGRRL
jgi:flagellar motor switch protein FliN